MSSSRISIALSVSLLTFLFPTGAGAAGVTCTPSWQWVASANVGDAYNDLRGVAAITANDVWAVGTWSDGAPRPTFHTLAEHWDGSAWTVVSTPTAAGNSYLTDGAAVSSTDVWAGEPRS